MLQKERKVEIEVAIKFIRAVSMAFLNLFLVVVDSSYGIIQLTNLLNKQAQSFITRFCGFALVRMRSRKREMWKCSRRRYRTLNGFSRLKRALRFFPSFLLNRIMSLFQLNEAVS